MHWGALISAMALVVVTSLAGCTEDEPAAAPTQARTPTAASQPSTPESPTTEPIPTETPPPLPPEAQPADVDGAAAFIRHYFDVVNYAYRTGDVAAAKLIRAEECAACNDIELQIARGYEGGGRIRGGLATVTDIAVTPGDLSTHAEALVVLSVEQANYLSGDGSVGESIPAAPELVLTVLLQKGAAGWMTLEWGGDDGSG